MIGNCKGAKKPVSEVSVYRYGAVIAATVQSSYINTNFYHLARQHGRTSLRNMLLLSHHSIQRPGVLLDSSI